MMEEHPGLKNLLRRGLVILAGVVLITLVLGMGALLSSRFRDALQLQGQVFVNNRGPLWSQLKEHLQMVFSAIGLAVVVGVSGGILLTRLRKLAGPVLGAASIIQTIPSLALVALMLPIFGVGMRPMIAALFLYALLPMLRNTYTAIDEVDPAVIEVGRGMGMTNWQILWRVEVPLCVPVVMAGIRTSTVIGVGIATLGAFAASGGLGNTIWSGMQQAGAQATARIVAGVTVASALALCLDGIAALIQELLTPTGLKLESGGG
ncbi:MAG: ABC transporter permease [Planctomycetota bacterium]